MEIVLSSWCRGSDICSPISPEDELIRFRYGGRAMNFCKHSRLEQDYAEAVQQGREDRMKALIDKHGRTKILYKNHMPARQIRDRLPDLWGDSFKFTIDRHPYEKVISAAYWEYGRASEFGRKPIDHYIQKYAKSSKTANYPLYTDRGTLIVDEVFRHDEMWEKLEGLAGRLGKTVPRSPPRAKSRFREDTRPAHEILTRSQKSSVQAICTLEFELLGWVE